ncbi:MAG: acyltransferase [Desulfobulbaceae bacterium]|nr:acyltransferase [Desulfobulbaceae bacterium]
MIAAKRFSANLTTGSPRIGYRPDIDGLRAVAVLSVFCFHLYPQLLPGGFLGVDVFFVISGYLITLIILRENRQGVFSFAHFYARRVKRIFPALFVVLMLSAPVAIFLLVPDTYTNFMASARYAAAQLANFFFARKVGYFEEGFSGQPLLHTWSLGVEEQFYLCWPLLIFLCFYVLRRIGRATAAPDPALDAKPSSERGNGQAGKRARHTVLAVFVVLAALSFVACFVLAEAEPKLAFYMFYTRAWEFCIGGAVALRSAEQRAGVGTAAVAGVTGLLLLGYSFLFVGQTYLGRSFLQGGVLLPCIGAALVIYAGGRSGMINRLLVSTVVVGVGRISYSLYLYHWPVIIFYKIFSNSHEIGVVAAVAIVALSLALATLSYFFVEQPARKTGWSDRVVLLLALLVIIVFARGFKILEDNDQASWRITPYAATEVPAPARVPDSCEQKEKDGVTYLECGVSGRRQAPRVALVGDSHSAHYLPAVVSWAQQSGYDVTYLGVPGCPMLLGDVEIDSIIDDKHEQHCARALPFLQAEIVEDPAIKVVMIAQRFDLFYDGKGFLNTDRQIMFKGADGRIIVDHTTYFRERLIDTVERLRAAGKTPIILKQVPILGNINDCLWEPRLKRWLAQERSCTIDRGFIEKWQQESIYFVDQLSASLQIPSYDPFREIDSPLLDGTVIYANQDHLNPFGYQLLIPSFHREMDVVLASGDRTDSGVEGRNEQRDRPEKGEEHAAGD